MGSHQRVRALLVWGVAAVCSLGAALTARAQEAQTLFAFSIDDPGALLAHEKDQGLARTLALLPERAQEIAHVFAGAEQGELARVLVDALGRPMRLGVDVTPPADEGAPPSFSGAMIVEYDDAPDAQALVDALQNLLLMGGLLLDAPAESATHAGMVEAPTPAGVMRLGRLEINGAHACVLTLGDVADLAAPFATLPAADGGTSIMRMQVDVGAVSDLLLPLIEGALAEQDGPMVVFIERVRNLLQNPPTWDFTASRTKDTIRSVSRVSNLAASASEWGLTIDKGLTAGDLEPIPAGASMAKALYIDLASLWDALAAPFMEDPDTAEMLGELEGYLGASVRGDILPAMGPTYAYYTSMGGAGASSPTFFTFVAQVQDREVIKGMLDRGSAAMNDALLGASEQLMGLGTVEVHIHEAEGATWYALQTTGLPSPLAPTFVLTDEWLVFALSPTSARAAAMQAMGKGSAGLGTRPEMAQAMQGGAVMSLAWIDSPTLAPNSFIFADIAMQALAMGVRSPAFPDRDPGVVMPTYDEWSAGVRPGVTVARWEGDDLVQRSEMDGSMLVSVATATYSAWPMILMNAPFQILAPALERARENARALDDAGNVKVLVTACIAYAAGHNGNYPASLDVLVEEGLIDRSDLISPFGPSADGEPDYFLKPGARDTLRADEIVIYSRAAVLAGSDDVSVGYADSHVSLMPFWELLDQMMSEPNDTVQWDVPGLQ